VRPFASQLDERAEEADDNLHQQETPTVLRPIDGMARASFKHFAETAIPFSDKSGSVTIEMSCVHPIRSGTALTNLDRNSAKLATLFSRLLCLLKSNKAD
jgi:hypothetical protein